MLVVIFDLLLLRFSFIITITLNCSSHGIMIILGAFVTSNIKKKWYYDKGCGARLPVNHNFFYFFLTKFVFFLQFMSNFSVL